MWVASCTTTISLVRAIDHLGEELPRGRLARRTVRIVDHQQLRPVEHSGRNRIEIGKEIIFGQQRQPVYLAAVVLRVRARHRIARHRHQRHVAGIDERGRQHRQRRFRADAMVHLGDRIQPTPNSRFMNRTAASLNAWMPLSA